MLQYTAICLYVARVSRFFSIVSEDLGLCVPCLMLRSRGTTKRTATSPLGDPSVNCVAEGNMMVARVALLCFLALARGIWVVIEQPKGSLLEAHPCMQALFKICLFWRKKVSMKDFGTPTKKDTWLYSSPGLKSLRLQDKTLLLMMVNAQQRNRVSHRSAIIHAVAL